MQTTGKRDARRGGAGRGRARRVGTWLAGLLAALAASAGCGDAFEGLLGPVPEEPTQVELTDFRTGALQRASAFDLLSTRPVRVDQTAGWDFLFFVTEQGVAQLRPFEAVTGELSEAGLQKVETSFEALTLAPQDGYRRTEPVPVAEGDVLAAVSRRDPAFSGLRCRRFGKLEVLELDVAGGRIVFRHLVNPNCEIRGLVPGETGSRE